MMISGGEARGLLRLLVYILLFIFFAGCSAKKIPFFIPRAFEYPEDSIGDGKVFIYHDSIHNRASYDELRTFVKEGDTVESYSRYNDTAFVDSQILAHGKLIETYARLSSLYPRVYKGENIVDMTIDDGTRLGRNTLSWTYRNDTLTMITSSESQFLKDTAILWKGVLLPCLVVQSNERIVERSKKYTGLNRTARGLLYGYYALRIGVIKYTLTYKDFKNNDHYVRWDLSSIK